MAGASTAFDSKPLPPLPPPSPTFSSPAFTVNTWSSRIPPTPAHPPRRPFLPPAAAAAPAPPSQTHTSRIARILRSLWRRSRAGGRLICCVSTTTASQRGSSSDASSSFPKRYNTHSFTAPSRSTQSECTQDNRNRTTNRRTLGSRSSPSSGHSGRKVSPATRASLHRPYESTFTRRSRRARKARRHRQRQDSRVKQRIAPPSVYSGGPPSSFYSWCSYCQEAQLRTTSPADPQSAVLHTRASLSDSALHVKPLFGGQQPHPHPRAYSEIAIGSTTREADLAGVVATATTAVTAAIGHGSHTRTDSCSSISSASSYSSSRNCSQCHPELFPSHSSTDSFVEAATESVSPQYPSPSQPFDSIVPNPPSDTPFTAIEHLEVKAAISFPERSSSRSAVAQDPSFSRFSWRSSQRGPSSLSVQRSDRSVEVRDLNPVPKNLAPPSSLYTTFATSFRAMPWFEYPPGLASAKPSPTQAPPSRPTHRKSWSLLQFTAKRGVPSRPPSVVDSSSPSQIQMHELPVTQEPRTFRQYFDSSRNSGQQHPSTLPLSNASPILAIQPTTNPQNGLSIPPAASAGRLRRSQSVQQSAERMPTHKRLLESRFQSFRSLHQNDRPKEPPSTADISTVQQPKRRSFLASTFIASNQTKSIPNPTSAPSSPNLNERSSPTMQQQQQHFRESPVERITMDQFKWSITCTHIQLSRAGDMLNTRSPGPFQKPVTDIAEHAKVYRAHPVSQFSEAAMPDTQTDQREPVDPRPALLLLLDNMPSFPVSPCALSSPTWTGESLRGKFATSESSSTWPSAAQEPLPDEAPQDDLPNALLPGSSHPNYLFKYGATSTKASKTSLSSTSFKFPRPGSTSDRRYSSTNSRTGPQPPTQIYTPILVQKAIRALYSPAVESLAEAVSQKVLKDHTLEGLAHFHAYILSVAPEEWIPWHLYDFFERPQGRFFNDLIGLLPTESQAVLILLLDMTRRLIDLSDNTHPLETNTDASRARRQAIVSQLSNLVFRPRPENSFFPTGGSYGVSAGASLNSLGLATATIEHEELTSLRAFENLYSLYEECHIKPSVSKLLTSSPTPSMPQNDLPVHNYQRRESTTTQQMKGGASEEGMAPEGQAIDSQRESSVIEEHTTGVRSLSLPPWRQAKGDGPRRQSLVEESVKETTVLPRTMDTKGRSRQTIGKPRRHTLSLPATDMPPCVVYSQQPSHQQLDNNAQERLVTTLGTICERLSEASSTTDSKGCTDPSLDQSFCTHPGCESCETEMDTVGPTGNTPSIAIATTREEKASEIQCSLKSDQGESPPKSTSEDPSERVNSLQPHNHLRDIERDSVYRFSNAFTDVPRTSSVISDPCQTTHHSTLPTTTELTSFQAAVAARPTMRLLEFIPRLAPRSVLDRTPHSPSTIGNPDGAQAEERKQDTSSISSAPTTALPLQSPSLFESMRMWTSMEPNSTCCCCCCDGQAACGVDNANDIKSGLWKKPPTSALSAASTTIESPLTTPSCDYQYHYFSSGCRHVKDNVYGADPWTLPLGQSSTRSIWDDLASSGVEATEQATPQMQPNTITPPRSNRIKSFYNLLGGSKDKDKERAKSKEVHPSVPNSILIKDAASQASQSTSGQTFPTCNNTRIHKQRSSLSIASALSPRRIIGSSWKGHSRRKSHHVGDSYNQSCSESHLDGGCVHDPERLFVNDDDITQNVIERWKEWHQKHFDNNNY